MGRTRIGILLILLAALAVSHLAFLAIGITIGRHRDAKVRDEIARFGTMLVEHLKAHGS